MKKIKIKGTFSGSVNNYCRIDVYRPNPNGYDLSKQFSGSFSEEIRDLQPGVSYNLDIVGYTTGSFALSVTGDLEAEINKTYTNTDFKPGFRIKIKAANLVQ
jgi:hypothetical protein